MKRFCLEVLGSMGLGQGRTPMLVLAVLLSEIWTSTPGHAVPLPPRSATASAAASFDMVTLGPFVTTLPSNGFADEMALAFVPGEPLPSANSSLATAASFTDLSLHTRSRIFSEDASVSANEAISGAGNVSHWVASAPQAGSNFDLDLTLSLDGALDVAGAAWVDTPFPDALLVEMEVLVTLHFPSLANTITAFNGLARLEAAGNPGLPANITFFTVSDFVDSDFTLGDTDFDLEPGFPTFGSRAELDFSTTIQQSVPAEMFAVEIELRTLARASGLFEEGFAALADFFDSGEFTLSTNTPGVTIRAVPEPACGGICLVLAALVGRLRQRGLER